LEFKIFLDNTLPKNFTEEPLQRKRRAPEKDGSGKNKQAQKDK
jgi:hypothetical protein